MSTPATEYWARYYAERHSAVSQTGSFRLDFSNERVRCQTYGMMLEAAGPLPGARCLDAGCGLGDMARLMAFLGGQVSGFDQVESTIARLRGEQPHIYWFQADLENIPEVEVPEPFDVIVACEVLQYVHFAPVVKALWKHVAPGGRLVGILPHVACPIVQNTQKRFENSYHGASLEDLSALARELPDLGHWMWRGGYFLENQSIVPYGLTAWSQRMDWGDVKIPNRLQFVLLRQPAAVRPA